MYCDECGFKNKETAKFCKRNHIYYNINPSYIQFTKLCDYIQKVAGIDEKFLMENNYETILALFTPEAREVYQRTERFEYRERNPLTLRSGGKRKIAEDEVLSSHNEKISKKNLEECIKQDIDMENYLNGNKLPKTQQEFLDYCNNGEYDVQDKIAKERQKLENIYQSCSNEMEFFKKIINDYTRELVPIFLKEYSDSMSNDVKMKISNLVEKGNVQVVTLDEAPSTSRNNKKGFAYCRENEKVFFSPYSINENSIERALQMKGTLIHEIHHIITNSLKEEPLVYKTEKENGEKKVTSISKSGIFFDEGLVEKSSLVFARKYNLFFMPSYRYSENVKFIDEVMAKLNISNVKNLFNKKYDDVLSNPGFSQDFLAKYKNFEWEKTLKNVIQKENSNEKISKENKQDFQSLKKTLLEEKKDLLIGQKEKENQYKLVRKSGYINIIVLLIVILVIVIFLIGR